ncbi:YbgA family protein [Salidesulfovibrio brasiliensis]|uniref:YbgA family protein n=1 Tax=Salidesulfovibrio brasiliensis TaxID=221711 RepID=UPI0006D0971E|nr:DUF523 and DUF1722 domain-containing protein [Salidesulfovibrio brasiliensis]
MNTNNSTPRPLVGISACLLGENVRYNGGHQRDRYICDTLANFVDFLPVCPEVGTGMGIPREPVRLVGDLDNPRLVGRESGEDWSERMDSWSAKKLDALTEEPICAFIFKAKSPSSGMRQVKVYPPEGGQPRYNGVGFFAARFMQRFPMLPVEDDGRLHDAVIRENFISRLFTFNRWLELLSGPQTVGALVDFHTRHKLLLMSHNVEAYRRLGKLVAHAKEQPLEDAIAQYGEELFSAMQLKATPKKHSNVLQHVMGYFKRQLTPDEKQECVEIIDAYRNGLVPLIVPVTLLNHYVRKYDNEYLQQQVYMHPHPLELKLRNQV